MRSLSPLSAQIRCSDVRSVNRDIDGKSLELGLSCDETVAPILPVGTGGRLEARSYVLLDDAGHYIFEFFGKGSELFDSFVKDLLGPLVHLAALVDDVLDHYFGYRFLGYSGDFFVVEFVLIVIVLVCHYLNCNSNHNHPL